MAKRPDSLAGMYIYKIYLPEILCQVKTFLTQRRR